MLIQTQSVIREASAKDTHKLANLIHFETFVHRHLDYRPPLDWLGKEPFLVLEQNRAISAALACQPDPPVVAWIRLFAANSRTQLNVSWEHLWAEARSRLAGFAGVSYAAAIPMQSWFEELLIHSAFEESHRIVMLQWECNRLPKMPSLPDLTIRPMSLDDLERVEQVDAASFPPIWQHSRAYLELAFRQAVVATVAEYNGRLIGYQISTASPMGGHLARLAIDPAQQGQGFGQALLSDVVNPIRPPGSPPAHREYPER